MGSKRAYAWNHIIIIMLLLALLISSYICTKLLLPLHKSLNKAFVVKFCCMLFTVHRFDLQAVCLNMWLFHLPQMWNPPYPQIFAFCSKFIFSLYFQLRMTTKFFKPLSLNGSRVTSRNWPAYFSCLQKTVNYLLHLWLY